MSQKPTSIPPKVLYQSILSTGMSFILNNIEGWDGNNLTSADFGTQAFGAFINADRTLIEFFEFDPSTIANSSITILYRGLGFSGSQTPVTANKLDWTANETTVLLGTDTPQFMALLASLVNDNAFTGANSFTQLPTSTGGNATSGTQLITYAQALAILTGSVSINQQILAGTAGETITKDQLIYLKVSDGRWWLADADTAATVENVILGIAQGAGSAAGAITNGVLTYGLATFTAITVTANTKYYASNTAGEMSSSAGTTEVTVGYALSTTTMFFNPGYDQKITEDQQDALAGTSGTPSALNKFVTNDDTSSTPAASKIVRYTAGSKLDATALTGNLPAIDGSALTNLPVQNTFYQKIPWSNSSNGGFGIQQTTSESDGSVMYIVSAVAAGTTSLGRFTKDTITGQYFETHRVASTLDLSSSKFCVIVTSANVFVCSLVGATGTIKKFSKTDLTSETSITVSGTNFADGSAGFSDGTDLYIYESSGTFRKFTISGTTATNAGTVAYTSGGNVNGGGAICNGTNVWMTDASNGAIVIRKYALAGGAVVSSSSFIFEASPFTGNQRLMLMNTGIIGLSAAELIFNATAQIGVFTNLYPVTAP